MYVCMYVCILIHTFFEELLVDIIIMIDWSIGLYFIGSYYVFTNLFPDVSKVIYCIYLFFTYVINILTVIWALYFIYPCLMLLSLDLTWLQVHHIPRVTEDFLAFLRQPTMEFNIHVTQHVDPITSIIGTANPVVVSSILTGTKLLY